MPLPSFAGAFRDQLLHPVAEGAECRRKEERSLCRGRRFAASARIAPSDRPGFSLALRQAGSRVHHALRSLQECADVNARQRGGNHAEIGQGGVSSADIRRSRENPAEFLFASQLLRGRPRIRDGDEIFAGALAFQFVRGARENTCRSSAFRSSRPICSKPRKAFFRDRATSLKLSNAGREPSSPGLRARDNPGGRRKSPGRRPGTGCCHPCRAPRVLESFLADFHLRMPARFPTCSSMASETVSQPSAFLMIFWCSGLVFPERSVALRQALGEVLLVKFASARQHRLEVAERRTSPVGRCLP